MTLHPEGKQGVNIEKVKYDLISTSIIEILREEGPCSFKVLGQKVKHRLKGKFNGSVSWYYTTVKLDLEARGTIERVTNNSPQMVTLKV